jgi:hypothetical protein
MKIAWIPGDDITDTAKSMLDKGESSKAWCTTDRWLNRVRSLFVINAILVIWEPREHRLRVLISSSPVVCRTLDMTGSKCVLRCAWIWSERLAHVPELDCYGAKQQARTNAIDDFDLKSMPNYGSDFVSVSFQRTMEVTVYVARQDSTPIEDDDFSVWEGEERTADMT